MSETHNKKTGTVYLVGAGPGDPGLITVSGLQRLESAEVVVYDRLVDRRLVARSPEEAEQVDVGKFPRESRDAQADINALLVSKAMEGKSVVRLKGGDPFVFGRGGEEAEALAKAGVPFQVVPGVTSAIAAPAYAGIPLTHRRFASSFTVVSGAGPRDENGSQVDWERLSHAGGTLVVLMGWENLSQITASLMGAGRSPETPVALVQWGSERYQRSAVGTLATIDEAAQREGLSPPVVAVVGEVVSLRDKLRWFDRSPLFGKRILVTRSQAQAGSLSELLFSEGAQPLELPTIEIQALEDQSELDAALAELGGFDWVVFPSSNAVDAVFNRLNELGRDSRSLHSVQVGAIGSATAASLRDRGIVADFVPEGFVSESVVEGMRHLGVAGAKVLIPGALVRRKAMSRGLEALGAAVREVAVYRNAVPVDACERLSDILEHDIDFVTFTSGSTVRNLVALLEGDPGRLGEARVACIGPVTAAAANEAGLRVDIEAERHTVVGLVEALKAYLERGGKSDG